MSRTRMLVLLACALGLTSWAMVRRSPAAQAAPTIVNNEETAQHRWETNQARHWRQVITRH